MAILARTVYVRDSKRNRDILLRAGEEPAPEYAALVTHPQAWEGGKVPETASDSDHTLEASTEEASAKPAAPDAKKTAASKRAASKPARGRDAADQGDSGA